MVALNQLYKFKNGSKIAIDGSYFTNLGPGGAVMSQGSLVTVLHQVEYNIFTEYLELIWNILEETLYLQSQGVSATTAYDAYTFLDDGTVDVSLSAYPSMYMENYSIVHPVGKIWYEVKIRKPTMKESSEFYLYIPTASSWIACGISLLIFSVILWLLLTYFHKFQNDVAASFSESTLSIIGCVTSQGFQDHHDSLSYRIYVFTMLLYGFILNCSYSAFLIVFLSVQTYPLPFNSLEELLVVRTHQICQNKDSYALTLFEEFNGVYYQQWQGLINGPSCPLDDGFIKYEHLVPALCTRNIIVLNSAMPPIAIDMENATCEITSLKPKYVETPIGLGVKKKFKHHSSINKMLVRLKETGILVYLHQKYVIPTSIPQSGKLETNWNSIKFGHIAGVLCLYSCAVCGAFLVLICEILLYRYRI